MKLDSKYFDKIRIKPDGDVQQRTEAPPCSCKGCGQAGIYPAPKGRDREGEYFHFCLDHVRDYNRSYNYFNGMSDDEVAQYLEHGVTGHRPTWSMGARGGDQESEGRLRWFHHTLRDPFGFVDQEQINARAHAGEPERTVRNAERKSLRALNLDIDATAEQIKARYKELVKRHHPDANGGDRASEDKLRDIITAYNYLKSVGFC